jgi:hypothetical protein
VGILNDRLGKTAGELLAQVPHCCGHFHES